jgi:beta-glucosidase
MRAQWLPSSPLKALASALPGAKVSYTAGENLDDAAKAAKNADVAIVFVHQWESEGMDLKTLALSADQNQLVETVAAVNKKTIVVAETGGPVTMPWVDKVSGVVEMWYPGIRGAQALAEILTGAVNPSAKLAITFPKSDGDLPHPTIVTPPPSSEINFAAAGADISNIMSMMAKGLPAFQTTYDEKLEVGYKWYDAEKKAVLFPFGHGLSYTSYTYSGLTLTKSNGLTVSFTVKNTGKRAGTEIAEVYASLPLTAGEPPKRLIGWMRVELAAGEQKQVTVAVEPSRLQIFDEAANGWKLVPGEYSVLVGGSSQDLPLTGKVNLE